MSGTLLVAADRYRADLTESDGDQAIIAGDLTCDGEQPVLPEPILELLYPSWLLADYQLELSGVTEYAGRGVYVAEGRLRETSRGRVHLPMASEHVRVLIDAELGILLRYAKWSPGCHVKLAEFTGLDARTAGAAGLDVRAARRAGDLDAELVNLLCRAGREPSPFAATLREITDGQANAKAVQQAVEAGGRAGSAHWLGHYVAGHPPRDIDQVARLQVVAPGSCRLDAMPLAPATAGVALIIDPAWLLSGYRLVCDGPVTSAGRPGVAIIAVPSGETAELHQGPLSSTSVVANRIETVIDRRLGIALRRDWYFDGTVVLRTELSDLREASIVTS